LVIGRGDDSVVSGVQDVFLQEEKLTKAISDSISPLLMPDIECVTFEGKSLLVVRVPHWKGPFYLKSKGPECGVYVRLGSTNRVAGPELLDELKRSLSNVSFDQLPCPEVGIEGVDMDRIQITIDF